LTNAISHQPSAISHVQRLPLPLLVFLVRADHPHHATAADDLALVANPFDRRSDFHHYSVSSNAKPAKSTKQTLPGQVFLAAFARVAFPC
jgi:hypothetical protein